MSRFGSGYLGLQVRRPDAALRRAQDLIRVGNVQTAWESLHDMLVSRRTGRTWTPAHEDMMMEYVRLSTELRESRSLKEGLYHYRSLSQTQCPESLERVVTKLIDLGMTKATEARARADIDVSKIEDLEDGDEAPESMLLGGVSSEGARARAEREVLVPWLRHVWDVFRFVLETVRYVDKLEGLYHRVAVRAMNFCRSFNRISEFRRLGSLLRAHYTNQRKVMATNKVAMTAAQYELHLTTRFTQLERCAEISQWNEAFRIIEDIDMVMGHATRAGPASRPKPVLMATYYERLARVFWVSDNFLFHAYAYYKFFELSIYQNRALQEEDKRSMASALLLAALAIPVYSAGPGTTAAYSSTGGVASAGSAATAALDEDLAVDREKKSRLAALLKLGAMVPSRETLLADVAGKGILRLVRPEVAALYRAMEVDFNPLGVAGRVLPILQQLKGETGPAVMNAGTLGATSPHSLSQYTHNLTRLLIFRIVEQLTAVYSRVKISTFLSLVDVPGCPLDVPLHEVEKLIVRAVKVNQLAAKIDHRAQAWNLGDDSLTTAAAHRRQLTELATRLQRVVDTIVPPSVAAARRLTTRSTVYDHARGTLEAEMKNAATRRAAVEQRALEDAIRKDAAAKKVAYEAQARLDEAQTREALRLAEEAQKREAAARAEAERQQRVQDNQRSAAVYGLVLDAKQLETLSTREIHVMGNEKRVKDEQESRKKREEEWKRLDYIVRAEREASRSKVASMAAAKVAEDAAYVAGLNAEVLAKAEAQFEMASANKARLSRMAGDAKDFMRVVMGKRKAKHEEERAAVLDGLKAAFMRQKMDRARARRDEELRARAREEERKRKAQEEAARAAKEEEDRRRALAATAYVPPSKRAAMGASGVSASAAPPAPAPMAAPAAPMGMMRGAGAAPASGPGAAAASSAPPAPAAGVWRPRAFGGGAAPAAGGSAAPPPPPPVGGGMGGGMGGGWGRREYPAPGGGAPAPAPAPSSGAYVPPWARNK